MEIIITLVFIVLFAFLILPLTSILVSDLSSNKNETFAKIAYCIALICVAILVIYVSKYINNKEIPAIEVYRGNTELQITYQDSIPIDSVVVYKK